MLPTAYPISRDNFNYTPVAVGSVLVLSLAHWVLDAHKWFKGPVRNIDTGRTKELCEAYEAGELDESDDAFGNESGKVSEE